MSEQIFCKRILRVAELNEEAIRERLKSLFQETNPEITLKDSSDAIDIQLCAQAPNHKEGERLLAQAEERIRIQLEEYIFGTEESTLQEVIGTYLEKQNLTVATMKSLTGGLIASALTDRHETSAHFLGGIVSYSTMLKERMGVPHELMEQYGVISEETARAMAQAVRNFLGSDIGLGITGVAGPDKQEDQPVGTVHIAIDGPYGLATCMGSEQCAGPEREGNKQAATISALNFLRRYLQNKGASS